jgi:hypothetical protein
MQKIYNRKSEEEKQQMELSKKTKGRRRASLHGCNFFGNSRNSVPEEEESVESSTSQTTRSRTSSFGRRRSSMSYGSLTLLLSDETRSYTNSTIGTGDTGNEDDFSSILVRF